MSAHAVAVAANKQDVIVRLGTYEDAVIALWPSVALIPDRITKADEGEVRLTAIMLADFAVTRTAGFRRIQTQHA